MVSFELIIAVIFYSIAGILIFKNRKSFERQGIVFLRRTQAGIGLMEALGKYKWFWKIFATIAIPVSVYFMFVLGKALLVNAYEIIYGTATAGVGVVIPGVRIPGSPIFIPLWYGVISIAILTVIHEFSHGVVAAMEGIRIKSSGFGFLAIIPLAFVEPDEEQMAKMPRLPRMRVAAAGAFGNLCAFFLISLFVGFVFTPFVEYNNVLVTGVTADTPASTAGIKEGMYITHVNNTAIKTTVEFINIMGSYSPGQIVKIGTDRGDFFVNLDKDPKNSSKTYMGIFLESKVGTKHELISNPLISSIVIWFYELFKWMGLLNFLIGVMNFLPVWFVDGGRIAFDLLGSVIRDNRLLMYLFNMISVFFLGLLIFNIFGPIFF